MKSKSKFILGALGSLAASTLGFVVVAYARSGRRHRGSPFLPAKLEHEINRLVFWLDKRVGKEWVDRGMDALQAGLKSTSPGKLVDLLEPMFQGGMGDALEPGKKAARAERLSYITINLGGN